MARLGLLALSAGVLLLLSLVPAWALFGADGLIAAAVSTVACFAPGCIVCLMSSLAKAPSAQYRGVLIGMLLRVAAALAAAAVMDIYLDLEPSNYAVWLAVSYLAMLAVETALILPRHNSVTAVRPPARPA
jgi:hypothetical protein